ncbi:MAG: hypothetical protein IJD84_10645 [Parabacteroides sp.]|nr:hypothetical protein [Parabacteroides sp.]
MKRKVISSLFVALLVTTAMAQDCTFFFPQTEGVQLVKKGYDSKGNLQSVMTYTIDEVDTYPSGMVVEADYIFQDSVGNVYDKGDIKAFCQNGEFFMEMKEVLSNPSFVSSRQMDIDVTDSAINYPHISAASTNQDTVYFDDAYIQIFSKRDRHHRNNVSVYDREYVTTEPVMTPAGTYDCTKVKYKIRSRSPKEVLEGYGYEWYTPNVGVVKNEQYDNNDQLQYYTILEVMK